MRVTGVIILVMALGAPLACDAPPDLSSGQKAQTATAKPRKATKEGQPSAQERFGLSPQQRMRCFLEEVRAEDRRDRVMNDAFDSGKSLAEVREIMTAPNQQLEREKAAILERYGLTEEQADEIFVEAVENNWQFPEPDRIDAVIESLPSPPLQFRTWTNSTGKHSSAATEIVVKEEDVPEETGEVPWFGSRNATEGSSGATEIVVKEEDVIECRAIYNEVEGLCAEAQAARKRRFSDAEWGVFIRDFHARVKEVRNRAGSLPPDNPAKFPLGASAGDLVWIIGEVSREKGGGKFSYDFAPHSQTMALADEAIERMEKERRPPRQTEDKAVDSVQEFPEIREIRIWTDDTGKHTVEAEFAGVVSGTTVKLRKQSGKVISMPLDRLSEADQEWIRERAKE